MMKKRILSLVMSLVMAFSLLPIQALAATVDYVANSTNNVTINVEDSASRGTKITNATVTVTRGDDTYTVKETGNGKYQFTKNNTSNGATYTITVSKEGYETKTVTIKGKAKNADVKLVKVVEVWQTFNVYYLVSGLPEKGYAASGNAANYGPSGDNTPMATINVNLTKLKSMANNGTSGVLYWEGDKTSNDDNAYEFVPVGNPDLSSAEKEKETIANIKAFWEAVKACMDAESLAAIEATGLGENFILYCLKERGSSKHHADGVLYVPPNITGTMFVVELYEKYLSNAKDYFWGMVVDGNERQTVDGEEIIPIPSMYDLLDQYELHLNQNITWTEENDGTPKLVQMTDGSGNPIEGQYGYKGTFIINNGSSSDGLYTIYIQQVPITGDKVETVSDWDGDGTVEDYEEYLFYSPADGYNIARFEMTVVRTGDVQYVVTYTDGVDGEEIFYDHEYSVKRGDKVPEFHAIPVREGYIFQGWWQEGSGDSNLLTSEEVAALTVNSNMTFVAIWQVIPKYTGTVEIILDGAYVSAMGTATGTRMDISDILGQDADMYVSADGENYIPLEQTSVGVYSAVLENGTYRIYYSVDEGATFVQLSEQHLVMQYADRTRYLFYNSVTYNPNGGTLNGSASNRVEYHYSGNAVNVYATKPEREGYIFTGWKEGDYPEPYQPDKQLTDNIERAYVLTAQWEKAANVYVTVVIDHAASKGGVNSAAGMHNITFTVDGREGASGDYSELYRYPILWDGRSDYTDAFYEYAFNSETNITTYTPTAPVLSNVAADWYYTATAAKTGYEIISSETVTDEKGDKHITLTLKFDPLDQNLTFRVELDEQAKGLDPTVWPKAVNVKVNCWYDDDTGLDWNVISQHEEVYQRVELDVNGEGEGTYPVWVTNEDGAVTYYYRVEVVSYELPDGTIVPAHDASDSSVHPGNSDVPHVNYHAEKHLYDAKVVVCDCDVPCGTDHNGADPDGEGTATTLKGAYFTGSTETDSAATVYTQHGTPTVIVSIPTFTVWIDPMEGTLNGEAFIEKTNQIFVPDMSRQIPVRDDGYVFHGWAWKKVTFSGRPIPNYVLIPALQAGDYLTHDLYLEAQWLPPITVEGTVTADATYPQDGGYQEIHEVDRAKTVIVLLQKDHGNGYYETVRETVAELLYSPDEYDEAGREVGYVKYQFTSVPQDGSYRITVLAPNYTALYQNEPTSLTNPKNYGGYTAEMFTALMGNVHPETATVNAHLEFEPPSFELTYRVDATQIGEGYRPQNAEVLVTYDDGNVAVTNPADWAVISQMVFGPEGAKYYKGDEIKLSDSDEKYMGVGSYPVWKTSSDGSKLYDYGIRVHDLTGGSWYDDYAHGTDDPRFEIVYQSPAHFDIQTEKQSRELVATLVPRTYSITYELNGGTFGTDKYPTSHTWSYKTIVNLIPTRSGYQFEGWEIQVGDGLPEYWDGRLITPDAAGDIIIRAKWSRVVVNLQVVISHVAEQGGQVSSHDKELITQLASRIADTTADFQVVNGAEFVRTYDHSDWHDDDTGVDTHEYGYGIVAIPMIFTTRDGLKKAYDYSVNVSMDGYSVVDSIDVLEDTDNNPETPDAVSYTATGGVVKSTVLSAGTTEIVHDVVVCLQYNPDLLDLKFSVEVDQEVEPWRRPESANVKVTCWYTDPAAAAAGQGDDWRIITQHEEAVMTVAIDPDTGIGEDHYPVWLWRNKGEAIPYYYRIEVLSLTLKDETVVNLAEKTDEVLYVTTGYTATVEVSGGAAPDGTNLMGAYGAIDEQGVVSQQGTLKAVIDMGKVVFHANNEDWATNLNDGSDVFRTYYPADEAGLIAKQSGDNHVLSGERGLIKTFYHVPEFDVGNADGDDKAYYDMHNEYIFKGWYTDPVNEDGTAMAWGTEYLYEVADDVHLYAHWVRTGTVNKEAEDPIPVQRATYEGFDLFAIQIRNTENDKIEHHGNAGSGLRYLVSLSEEVHDTLYDLSDDTEVNNFEYGILLASSEMAQLVLGGDAKGTGRLLYNGSDVNGENTSEPYYFVSNITLSGVPDHYNGTAYRVYTCVVTYNGNDDLRAANLVARAYIRYLDANKLLRIYYNNYTGTPFYGGVSISYDDASNVISNAAAGK